MNNSLFHWQFVLRKRMSSAVCRNEKIKSKVKCLIRNIHSSIGTQAIQEIQHM